MSEMKVTLKVGRDYSDQLNLKVQKLLLTTMFDIFWNAVWEDRYQCEWLRYGVGLQNFCVYVQLHVNT